VEVRASESAFNSSLSLDSTCSIVYPTLKCRNIQKIRGKSDFNMR